MSAAAGGAPLLDVKKGRSRASKEGSPAAASATRGQPHERRLDA
jgi:hypothetical protein